jgi:hypothetical protein
VYHAGSLVTLGGGVTIGGLMIVRAGMTGPEALLTALAAVVVLMITRSARIRRAQRTKVRVE